MNDNGQISPGVNNENALEQFLNHDTDDPFCNAVMRIDSSEIVYATEKTKVSFIGDRYLKGEQIGEGSYSKVKEVLDVKTLCRRAIKIVKLKKIRKIPNGHANVLREIQLLRKLSHRNVIQLIESFSCTEKHKLYIVLEFCCCNLQEMLDQAPEKKFPDWQSHFYFLQVLEGLQYLHSRGIIHKDIKPGNLLLTLDQTLKITDLGVSEELNIFATDDKITTSQGSPAFQSPEIASGNDHFLGYKVDVWSTGVTLYNMTTGLYPFEGDNIYKLFENIAQGKYTVPDTLTESLQDLIKGMLRVNGEERFSILDVKAHIWYRNQIPQTEPAVLMPCSNSMDPYMSMTTLPHLHAWINNYEEQQADNFFGSDEEVVEMVMGATPVYNNTNNAAAATNAEAPLNNNAQQREKRKPSHKTSGRKAKAKNCTIC